jgi:hypothetical protein
LNLMKFVGPGGEFDVEAFRHACDTVTLAQEIISTAPVIRPKESRRIRMISARSVWATPTWARC